MMNNYFKKFRQRLKSAIKEGNEYALRINDKNEKYIKYKLWQYDVRKEELAIKILKLIKEYDRISESKLYKRYFNDLYSYSGEWGIDNYYYNNRTPNKDKLDEITS